MLRKAFMLVSGNAFGSALLLLRNLIIARLISPEDYGIASTFAIAMSIVEMFSYFGLNQMIVVDKDGDDPGVQKALQGFQLIRGVTSSILLFAIAYPYARFLGIEEIAWAYQAIAFIPLVNGLQHFDMHRLKRHLNFTPWIVTQAVPPLISVLSVWPLALYFGDYRIMLIALFVQAGAMVILSHLMAERRYGVTFDFGLIRRATVFGWPLLLNGILLFGVFNGERLIVGRELGMSQLAIFSMSITLTLTPTLVLAGAVQSLFLPQLGAARDRDESFRWLGVAATEAGLAIGIVLLIGVVLLGGPVIHLLLGPKYAAILEILVPMTVVQALRVAKTGGSTVALSKERSGNAAVANLFRVLSLPVSWYAVTHTGTVMTVIYIAMVAELLGYLVSLNLAARRTGLPLKPLVLPSALTAMACVAALIDARYYPPQTGLIAHLDWSRWAVVAVCLAALASMSALRGYLWRRVVR
ncbi:oligosaccharide flippase family protein [Defluviimonas sp. SAOS-178_SWC]|uniref:oligosaccharide flippase family protein n=1 Tax=Defluviimonas sp. SAOS-178_SWC TaxID=3121287 RepID=UPI0032217D9C